MKKIFCVLSVIMFLFMYGCNNAETARDAYEKLLDKIENSGGQISDEEIANGYAKIFNMIANGDKSEALDYAELVNDIAYSSKKVVNEDNVFSVAKDYAEYFRICEQKNFDSGVRKVSINDGQIRIDYIGQGGYKIRKLDTDEEIFCGEDIVSAEDLGEYRYEIEITDIKVSEIFSQTYNNGTAEKLQTVPSSLKGKVNLRYTVVDDSTVMIYIGFDVKTEIEEKQFTKLVSPMSTIEIPFDIVE